MLVEFVGDPEELLFQPLDLAQLLSYQVVFLLQQPGVSFGELALGFESLRVDLQVAAADLQFVNQDVLFDDFVPSLLAVVSVLLYLLSQLGNLQCQFLV